MCAFCELSLMKNLKGTDAVPKIIFDKYCFRFPRCDCGISRWIVRPDCSSISFSSSTESELHGEPASLIQVVVVVVQMESRSL